jgi:phage-related protein
MQNPPRPLRFIGTAHDDLRSFPAPVQDEVGYALYLAQIGDKSPIAKPLRGFRGAGVLEVVSAHDGDTYRAVYTVRLTHAVYVLHCFQKKSTQGITTAQRDRDAVARRLRLAELEDRALGER